MRFRNSIQTLDVYNFKETFCEENQIICHHLQHTVQKYIKSPILDVGAGIGDISFKALGDKKVIMIDVNKISRHDYPCQPGHVRKQCDFFDFESKEQINTVLISHTLQFIDDSVDLLNEKIREINPETVIQVLNTNDDFMGDLMEWCNQNTESSNPEIKLDGFPRNYTLIKTVPFTALLRCPDFMELARQVSYLMLIELDNVANKLVQFLKKMLNQPEFTISQVIEIYKRNERR